MKLCPATSNSFKIKELRNWFADAGLPVEWVGLPDAIPAPDVEEDAETFAGNAAKKARAWRELVPFDTWVLADDSGLCVDRLNGAPGVESARFAGPAANDADNRKKLIRLLSREPQDCLTACFACCLVLAGPSKQELLFQARCFGRVITDERGTAGFGYDSMFIPDGYKHTFAELGDSVKQKLSHRAKALSQLATWLRKYKGLT